MAKTCNKHKDMVEAFEQEISMIKKDNVYTPVSKAKKSKKVTTYKPVGKSKKK